MFFQTRKRNNINYTNIQNIFRNTCFEVQNIGTKLYTYTIRIRLLFNGLKTKNQNKRFIVSNTQDIIYLLFFINILQ